MELKGCYLVSGFFLFMLMGTSLAGIGVNLGLQSTHPLAPWTTVRLIKENGIEKVKLLDADAATLDALSKSGIQVMVGIPNNMLPRLANSHDAARNWVLKNVSQHVSNSVNIKHVAVGNEQFSRRLNGTYIGVTLRALENVQSALDRAGLGSTVKVTVPLSADIYQSATNLPSDGNFRSDVMDHILEILNFLSLNKSPFTVNIQPFISLHGDPNFPEDFAFFDGTQSPMNDMGRIYDNVFDASLDTLIWSLQRNGYGDMPIIVGEIGWPSDGEKNANLKNARRFHQGFLSRLAKGTPMREAPLDAYISSLIDEDQRSVELGNFERHWGLFYFDGKPKYQQLPISRGSLVPATGMHYLQPRWCVMSSEASLEDPELADSISFACWKGDCTSIGLGSSCANLDAHGQVSYAFNNYYQIQDQAETACQFPNSLSVVTNRDPSTPDCKFMVMIDSEASSVDRRRGPGRIVLAFAAMSTALLVAFM